MVDQLLKREEQTLGEGQNRQGKDEDDGDLATIDRESEVSESASPVKVGLLVLIICIVGDTEQCVCCTWCGGEA
jgi:hypothetical protein